MLEFLRPIVILDTWLYICSGLFALFFLRLMWLARRDRVRSIFTLERENASVRFTRAFTGFMITLAFMLGVYYLSLITPEILPPSQETPTPTPIILPPTPTPPPLLDTPTPTPTLLPTSDATVIVPLPEQGGETPTPAPPPPPQVNTSGQPPNCPNPQARIVQPGNGARVDGVIQVRGAAATENFEYYKFEFRPVGVPDWSFVARYDNSVPEGVLGSWNSDTVQPGEYEFRLVVVDQTGNFPEPCILSLIVQ